jgi:intracellular multiplication protein IcmL
MVAVNLLKEQHDNEFYRLYQPRFLIVLMGAIIVTMIWAGIVVFQVYHRPFPSFHAITPTGQRLMLQPQDLPNLTPATILRFASKAAVAAYTFDFVNYRGQIGAARTYFTNGGWDNYTASVAQVVKGIAANKLFVTGVVNGTPVISNQGELNGVYSWRVQLPFLVTYQSAQSSQQSKYTVLITIVRVPTTSDPLGIGIDQFVMSS